MKTEILLAYVVAVFGFARGSLKILQRLNNIEDRIDHIEERFNAESKIRREDFNSILDKLNQIESKLENVKGGDTDEPLFEAKITNAFKALANGHSVRDINRLNRLAEGFKNEKAEHMRTRRELSAVKESFAMLAVNFDNKNIKDEQILKNLEITANTSSQVMDHLMYTQQNLISISDEQKTLRETVVQRLDELQSLKITAQSDFTTQILDMIENNTSMCKNVFLQYALLTANLETTSLNPRTVETTETQMGSGKCSTCSSCADLFRSGTRVNGVYKVTVNQKTVSVYCDMSHGAGWTVFQRRQDGSEDFYRGWQDYKDGFGDLTGEFWLGNEYLHLLTNNGTPKQLQIEMIDYHFNLAYALYDGFSVGSESEGYMLNIGSYSGNASDSLSRHNNKMFSTKDKDNDVSSSIHCAQARLAGWWFKDCTDSNLNGMYETSESCKQVNYACIHWYHFKRDHRPLKFTEMKFR